MDSDFEYDQLLYIPYNGPDRARTLHSCHSDVEADLVLQTGSVFFHFEQPVVDYVLFDVPFAQFLLYVAIVELWDRGLEGLEGRIRSQAKGV